MFNPLRDESFSRNMNISLRFVSFIVIENIQAFEICQLDTNFDICQLDTNFEICQLDINFVF